MKLTKSKLKRVIKEELRKVLREQEAQVTCKQGYVPDSSGLDCIPDPTQATSAFKKGERAASAELQLQKIADDGAAGTIDANEQIRRVQQVVAEEPGYKGPQDAAPGAAGGGRIAAIVYAASIVPVRPKTGSMLFALIALLDIYFLLKSGDCDRADAKCARAAGRLAMSWDPAIALVHTGSRTRQGEISRREKADIPVHSDVRFPPGHPGH